MGDVIDFRPKVESEEEQEVFIAICGCEDRVPLDSVISMDSGAPVVVGLQCGECSRYYDVHNGVVGMGDGEIH